MTYVLIVAVYFSSWGPVLYRKIDLPNKETCLQAAKDVRIEMPKMAAADSAGIVVIQCVPKGQEINR